MGAAWDPVDVAWTMRTNHINRSSQAFVGLNLRDVISDMVHVSMHDMPEAACYRLERRRWWGAPSPSHGRGEGGREREREGMEWGG